MKTAIFAFMVSIFFATNICSAQQANESVMLCNLPGKKLAQQDVKMPVDSLSQQISIVEIKLFLESGCDKIIYTNAKGEELKITNFIFAYTYKNGNSYFEQYKGNTLTNSMKAYLKKAAPGDKCMIAINGSESIGAAKYTSKATKLYKVVE